MGVAGFEEFYVAERNRLVQLCWLLTLDRDVAAESAQEVLARLWENWDELGEQGANPRAWARTVAVNLCSNQRRRGAIARRWRHLVVVSDVAEFEGGDVDLIAALQELSPRQRQAVVLRFWADLDVAGCAGVMGVSAGSVKQHLSRALGRLRMSDELVGEEL